VDVWDNGGFLGGYEQGFREGENTREGYTCLGGREVKSVVGG